MFFDLRKRFERSDLLLNQQNVAVISSFPLGDGFIAAVFANNCIANGIHCSFYHPLLKKLNHCFPDLKICDEETVENAEAFYQSFDKMILFFDSTPLQKQLIAIEKRLRKNKLFIIIPTLSKPHPLSHVQVNPKINMVQNALLIMEQVFGFVNATAFNGIQPVHDWTFRKIKKRVLIHPTAGQEKKVWPLDRFLLLYRDLKSLSFEPLFVISPSEEKALYPVLKELNYQVPDLPQLVQMIYESGYLIGNDSGLGHVASCLNIPVLSIFWNRRMSRLWQPGWKPARIIAPSPFLLNMAGLKLRDRYWKQSISVKRVLKQFEDLVLHSL